MTEEGKPFELVYHNSRVNFTDTIDSFKEVQGLESKPEGSIFTEFWTTELHLDGRDYRLCVFVPGRFGTDSIYCLVLYDSANNELFEGVCEDASRFGFCVQLFSECLEDGQYEFVDDKSSSDRKFFDDTRMIHLDFEEQETAYILRRTKDASEYMQILEAKVQEIRQLDRRMEYVRHLEEKIAMLEEKLKLHEMKMTSDYFNGTTHFLQEDSGGGDGLRNGWKPPGNNYRGMEGVHYFKNPLGVVTINGIAVSGTAGETIFTLKQGYRPERDLIFSCMTSNGSKRVDVKSNGEVYCTDFKLGGQRAMVSFSGITFLALK